jgi:signal transduction histidine kinase
VARDITQRKHAEALLRRQERVQATTADVRLSMLSNNPLEETFGLICGRVDQILDTDGALIAIAEVSGLRVAAAAGSFTAVTGLLLDESSLVKEVLESGDAHALAVGDADIGEQLAIALSGDDQALVVAPVPSDRGPLGMLATVGPPGRLGSREIPIVEGLAGSAALAVELAEARQAREHLLLAGDRERIARDLHDLVIQRLFSTGMGLQGVLGLMTPGLAAERVAAAVNALDDTIREIRTTIFALATPRRADTGLRAEILGLVASANEQLRFEPNVRFDGPVDSAVSDEVNAHVLAVVREALSNMARHANASRADIELRVGDEVVLVVSDDGVGIGEVRRDSGLANLRARAESLGGTVRVGPGPAGGTRLEWRVPVRP